jgi:hypothetical protein
MKVNRSISIELTIFTKKLGILIRFQVKIMCVLRFYTNKADVRGWLVCPGVNRLRHGLGKVLGIYVTGKINCSGAKVLPGGSVPFLYNKW